MRVQLGEITIPAILSASALAGSMLALGLLRIAWSCRQRPRGALIVVAWLLIAVLVVSAAVVAKERGVALLVLIFVGVAMGYVTLLFVRAPHRQGARPERAVTAQDETPPPGVLARRAWVFVLAGPAAAAVTVLLCALFYALMAHAGALAADAIVSAAMLAPIVLGGLICWMLIDTDLVRRSVGLLGLGGLGAAALFLT